MINEADLPNDRIIAIDGTSGSGKSTLARGLGETLGLKVLETGSLYRATTLKALNENVDVHDEDSVVDIAESLDFTYEDGPKMGGVDVSVDITRHDVVLNVSQVSVHPRVRAVITDWVRSWILDHDGGVVEGRDITTVVAPNAKVQVYVDAPQEIRATRRQEDKVENHENLDEKQVSNSIAFRDNLDSTRTASPLIKAHGVYEIDSSKYTPQEMIDLVVAIYKGV